MASTMGAKKFDFFSTLAAAISINRKATNLVDLIDHSVGKDEIHAGDGTDTVIGGAGKDLL